jgi:hypothetical protein
VRDNVTWYQRCSQVRPSARSLLVGKNAVKRLERFLVLRAVRISADFGALYFTQSAIVYHFESSPPTHSSHNFS